MYLGKLMEEGPTGEFFGNPVHPYSRALLSAIPTPSLRGRKESVVLEGRTPGIQAPPPGCRFHTRCPIKMDRCQDEEPAPVWVGPDHRASCFRSGG
jgi:oligopeptide/dipeptide ABC transporter ATP-binding protein